MNDLIAKKDLGTNNRLLLLNENDVDGCVDIARDGIDKHMDSKLMKDFIQRLANNVARQAYEGQPIPALDSEDETIDLPLQTFTCMAIDIQPLQYLSV
jgi:hypothetical protein